MHCDTISELTDKGGELRENSGQLDLRRMRQSGYLLQNFALFVDIEKCVNTQENEKIFTGNGVCGENIPGKNQTPWERVQELYKVYCDELHKNEDWISPVYCYKDILHHKAAGKMSALLTVEEGAVCGGSLDRLRKLYEMGVRMLTLTWNYPNELGWPATCRKLCDGSIGIPLPGGDGLLQTGDPVITDNVKGLTEIGREFVMEMENLGMIPDVSHLSDAGFDDVWESTTKPFVASHSNAREICPSLRNLTDDRIRKLADRGGCIGLNYYDKFLMDGGSKCPEQLLEAVVRHARYIANVGGTEVLGLGSDFDGIPVNAALPGAESMPLLWGTLKKAGFSENELDGIFWKNVLRVYREVL